MNFEAPQSRFHVSVTPQRWVLATDDGTTTGETGIYTKSAALEIFREMLVEGRVGTIECGPDHLHMAFEEAHTI